MENTYTVLFCLFGSIFFIGTISIASSIRVVREDTRLSVYRLGRYLGDKGPGLVLLIPFIDRGVLQKLGSAEDSPSRKLVGVVGESRTTVFTDGQVMLAGEVWHAVSQSPISAGQRVRVVRMILEVEKE